MNYGELFEADVGEAAICISDANTAMGARRLVSTYTLSDSMVRRLAGLVLPELALNATTAARAMCILGARGTGRSHWLAFVSGLAEHAELTETCAGPTRPGLTPTPAFGLPAAVAAIAGRFKVVRADVAAASEPLDDTLLGIMAADLVGLGIAPPPSPVPAGGGKRPPAETWIRSFEKAFPDHGLLLVVDGLSHYLDQRTDAGCRRDWKFLEGLAALAGRSRFRLLLELRISAGPYPGPAPVPDPIRAAQTRFVPVHLDGPDLRTQVAGRWVRKTPAQRARVAVYLAKFASVHPAIQERLDEFVDLFPIHPDLFAVYNRLPPAARRRIRQALAEALRARLDASVPDEHVDLVSYDCCWSALRDDRQLQVEPGIDAVLAVGRKTERRIHRAFPQADRRRLALRLLHALGVHRLTTDDVYSRAGTTAAELCQMLCPATPGSEPCATESQNRLQSEVESVLRELAEAAPDRAVTFDPATGQWRLYLRRFRRFVTPELVLHWVNAVPFLALMITGGTMLSSRFWHMDHAVFARIVLIHKGFALFWVLGMPLVLALRPRVHWLHLGAMLRWGRADILWMVQSIRSLYNKKAVIAPAGRFNTGQKVNACLVFLYFVGFVCTGACMTFQGAILIPWYIHTALFFASLSSVGGHLYLSLFNPGTRAALPGIFHGWSPMEYIEHHHPLSLPRPHQSHIPPASLRTTLEEIAESKVELAMILATLAMAGIGVWAFNRGRMTSAKLHFASTFASLISPSQLTTQHRLAPGGDSCTLCHSYMGGIPNRHCEKCHVVIAEHRAHQVGYHGTLKGDCIQCHKEHPDGTNSIVPLVRATFDHTLTGYPIEGRHVRLDCDECHRKKRTPAMPGVYFIGLKHDTCGDCHRDPHARPFAADCDRCHSVAGWTGTDLKFRHDTDTTYPLAGRHQTVECIACHKPPTRSDPLAGATFRGLSRDCTACHADPHRQQFAAVCTSCHSPAGWHGQALTFDHGRDSKFPLIGKHATLACAKCHQPADRQPLAAAQFAGLRSGCADCHTDPHQGQLAQACTACHSTAGWAQARLAFNHNRDSRFLLAAKHAAVACEKCHTPTTPGAPLAKARFRGLPAECADCHQDPHRGQFARTCVRCHPSPDGWRLDPLRFDHRRDTSFALTGRHNGVQCDRCHQPTPADGRLASAQFKDLGTACDGCHRTTHPQAYGGACISCHTPALWIKKDPGISHILKHKASGEELNGKHLTATCRECHTPARLAILGQAGQPGFACLTCHKPDDPHKGTLDDNCVKCHGVDGWKDESLRFNHDTMAAFALDDDHRKLACARCHENGHWKPLDSKCVSCHPKFFDRKKT